MTNVDEIWRLIPGFKNYEISNLGRCRRITNTIQRASYRKRCWSKLTKISGHEASLKFGYSEDGYRYLKSRLANGYPMFSLRDGGPKRQYIKAHRAVALAFIPNPENKPCVNHIDGSRDNCRIENLEWCTPKENMEHEAKLGRVRIGIKNPACKLTHEQVIDIRALLALGKSIKGTAKAFDVSRRTIKAIKTGQRWNHVK